MSETLEEHALRATANAPRRRPPLLRRHPLLFKLFASLMAFTIFLVLAELGFRAVRYLAKGSDRARAETAVDPELGWRLNTRRGTLVKSNKCGESVTLDRDEHPYLVKTADDEHAIRVLFLGDSFTQAHEVSSGRAYYDVFEEKTRDAFSVYAAGVGGFGNLQEYLLLEKVYDEVRPDVVVWQLHRNDVSNNVYALDSGSFYNNQRPRPYLELETGEIYVADPGFFLFDVSALFRFLFHKMLALDWTYDLGLLEAANSLVAPAEEDLPALQREGLEVLGTVLRRAMASHPNVRFIGLSTGGEFDEEFRAVFEGSGAAYLAGFYEEIAANPDRTDCRPLDDHWNHRGNEVAGGLLAERIGELLAP